MIFEMLGKFDHEMKPQNLHTLQGYYEESGMYGIMEIECGDDVKARWLRTGSMTPRANHSATYVPPQIAGPLYPDGYLVVFGGCINGANSNALSLLDLSTYDWSEMEPIGVSPPPQNSHSATLVPRSSPSGDRGERGDSGERECSGDRGRLSRQSCPAILFLGGGGGDDSNGGPPRGGHDFVASKYWLLGLEGANFRWEHDANMEHLGGRGHVAVRLSGTSTTVVMGGGRPPLHRACAVSTGVTSRCERLLQPVGKGPAARAFGGGCALPDGLAFVYGGWHPCKGTFADVWVACFDDIGRNSAFFQQLPASAPGDPEEPDEADSADDMAFNLVIRRLFGQMEGMEGMEDMEGMEGEGLHMMHAFHPSGQEGEDSDSEEEPDENDENSEDTDEAEPQTQEERIRRGFVSTCPSMS